LLGKNRKKTYVKKEKVIAGEKTEKNLSGKPVSIYNEVNTLCSGAT
jgi:hypothetical protein